MGGGQSSDRPKKTHNLDEAKPAESVHFAKFFEGLPVLDAKVVAITGCTTGTGYAAAEACARKGAHVIMLNRQSERAEAALAKVKAAAPNARVDLVPCDLMDLDSMRSTAVKVKALVQRIDVLANNAGIMASVDKGTSSGFDIQMQTNHLSHFLLTKELMPLLEAADAQDGGEARIVNHSSLARRYPPLKRDYFEKKGGSLGGDGWGMMMSGPRFARYR